MRILGQFSSFAAPLAVAFSFLLSSGDLRASGPGIAGSTGSTTGVGIAGGGSVGASVGGGSRGGVAAPANAGRSIAAPTMTGARPGVSFSNSAPRLSTGGIARSPVGRMNPPASYAPGSRAASPTVTGPQPIYRNPSRPANSWSGTAVASADNPVARNNSPRQLYQPNGYTNNRFAGQHLNPGAYGANLPENRATNNWSHHRHSQFPYRYYNYPYSYGPIYAPYIGYYGGYEGVYPYYADAVSPDGVNIANGGTATVTPQYADQSKDTNNDQQNPATQPAPPNQGENRNAQPTVPNNGPDSLVEAVQQELIRRGYFGGKVDAMYGPDTKEALRKFQQDHHLADSGLINEATLHALQLD